MAEPAVPSDNNAAERSLGPLVMSRKISGGTDNKMALASLFGAWHLRAEFPDSLPSNAVFLSTLNCYVRGRVTTSQDPAGGDDRQSMLSCEEVYLCGK